MEIKKTVNLTYMADDKSFAMSTVLQGDGAPVYNKPDDTIKEAQKEFMAAAIAEQKSLCKENGVNPDLVNKVGAEKETEEK